MIESTGHVISYVEALYQSMRWALEANDETLILGQGVDDHKGIFGTTAGLADDFGRERVMDTPLAEEGTTGIAVGAALNGLYPITTHIRADFVLLAANQIVNLAAKYKYMFGGRYEVPMLIRAVVGRSWGQGAQHSQSLQSLFAHIPGLVVVMPSSPATVLDTYKHVIGKVRAPVISFEHRLLYNLDFQVSDLDYDFEDPLRSRLVREGLDVTIVATSIMVLEARRAAEYLAKEAMIDCEIIDLHCVSHPDQGMIVDSVRKTGRLLIADTSWSSYGVAAEICRMVCETGPHILERPVISLGMAEAPCPTAKALEDIYYPNLANLVDAAARLATGRDDHGVTLPNETSMTDIYKKFRGPF